MKVRLMKGVWVVDYADAVKAFGKPEEGFNRNDLICDFYGDGHYHWCGDPQMTLVEAIAHHRFRSHREDKFRRPDQIIIVVQTKKRPTLIAEGEVNKERGGTDGA